MLILYSEKQMKKNRNFYQQPERKCWKCGSTEHVKKDCPQGNSGEQEKATKSGTALVQFGMQTTANGTKYIENKGERYYLPHDF